MQLLELDRVDTEEKSERLFGLLPVNKWKIYELKEAPGRFSKVRFIYSLLSTHLYVCVLGFKIRRKEMKRIFFHCKV